MFDESNSLSSTNLRKTIGFTSFGGTGEEHCDTTNDCWQEGGGKPCRNVEGEGATYDTGGEKVDTKEGTTKFGLPCNWLTDPILVAEIGGKPRPEAAISNA